MRTSRVAGWVTTAVLAAVTTACSDDGRPDRSDASAASSRAPSLGDASASPTEESGSRVDQVNLDKLMDKVRFPERVAPGFELRDVEYTSPTDAVAELLRESGRPRDRGTLIATTDDGWAHASRVFLREDLSESVEAMPLGDGAVAVKLDDGFAGHPYPPFVLYPDGEVRLLRIAAARPLASGEVLLDEDRWGFFYEIGRSNPGRLWAADAEASEIHPVEASTFGDVWQRVPGRRDALLSVDGHQRATRTWRFATSVDAGRSWTSTVVDLPSRRRFEDEFVPVPVHAVGPGRLQAVAMTQFVTDSPRYLLELWQTEDEETFRRVRVPWEPGYFGGIAYTSDGALLIAEVEGFDSYCRGGPCTRPGRIWRLAAGSAEPQLARGAPRLFGPFWNVGIETSGGVIVARTGMRTVAVSEDGYSWTEVAPGR